MEIQPNNIVGLPSSVQGRIDHESDRFTTTTRLALGSPADWHDDVLGWLCMEHYQFSKRNPSFLQQAAVNTSSLLEQGIAKELQRNFEEEKTHSEMYRRALAETGINVETHIEFTPTTIFLDEVQKLVEGDPSRTLGAIYATETAAIFEHQVFRGISVELIARRNAGGRDHPLIRFHDMHLEGVEQAHKDNLGVFLRADRGIDETMVSEGALNAIGLMRTWWNELLQYARSVQTKS
jgi:hypothetical protein